MTHKRILIVEPWFTGHLGVYVERLVRYAVSLGHQVDLATSDQGMSAPIAKTILEALAPNGGRVFEFPAKTKAGPYPMFGQQVQLWRLYRAWFVAAGGSASYEIVVVPYGDTIIYAMALLGSPFPETDSALILMRVSAHFEKLGISNRHSVIGRGTRSLLLRLAVLRANRCSFMTIDESWRMFQKQTEGNYLAKRIQWAPDPGNSLLLETKPAMPAAELRQRYGISDNAFLILGYGAINSRKGVDSLVRAMTLPSMPANVVILLAGVSDQATKDSLKAAGEHLFEQSLVWIEKFLSCEEEAEVVRIADAVWLGYRDHDFMSGVMVLAGQGKKPIIACRNGVIGYLAAKTGLGVTVDVDDPDSVVEAVRKIVRDTENRMGLAGFERFADHTDENFSSAFWTNALAKRRGAE